MFERIESIDDPRIAAYRDLPDPELVRRRGLFMAEGRLVIRRVIADERWHIHSVLVNQAARESLASALDAVAERTPVYLCDAEAFCGITGFNIHRGCLALVERPAAQPPEAVIAQAHTVVVLEAVANADNVGGIFRNAAAFGADAVLLSPACCDPLYRKAIRTSMGATLRVPYARAGSDDWPGVIARVRAAGFRIVALTPRAPSETLDAFQARPRWASIAVILGPEGA